MLNLPCEVCGARPKVTRLYHQDGLLRFFLVQWCACEPKRDLFETEKALDDALQVWNVTRALLKKW